MIQRVVVAGILIKNNKVLIVQRSKNEKSYPNYWELPSGKVNLKENPNQAVKREFREETGISIEVVKPLSVTHFVIDKKQDTRHNVQINYLVKSKKSEVKLSDAHQNFAWITPKDFNKYRLFVDLRKAVTLALKERK